MDKKDLRKKCKDIRKNLNINEISLNIQNLLFSTEEYKNAKNILTYYSFKDEVSTIELLKDNSKKWFLPRINEQDLIICNYDNESLIKNSFGIFEPCTNPIDDLKKIDLVILPGLACDYRGNRMGYGKGFYDRFLSKLEHKATKILLLPEELIFENLYPANHDVPVDIVITQNRIVKF